MAPPKATIVFSVPSNARPPFFRKKESPRRKKKMAEWEETADSRVYEVRVFDDGNADHAVRANRWYIVARWRGKVSLRNVADGVVVRSISEWKVALLA